MKKFLASILLIIPIAVLAEDFGMNVPKWEDFAPNAFIDVKEPKGLGKFNVTAKYWFERKIAFEEDIEACKSIESYEERFNCYEVLKIRQYKENTDYNAKIEAQQQSMSNIPEMNNRVDSMIPINMFSGYTQMMPNELRGY